jgi:hypothetical protein
MLKERELVLSLTIAGLAGCGAAPAPNPSNHNENPIAPGEIGSRLPNFSVRDLAGRDISSTALAGKVVLIDFGRLGASHARSRCPAISNRWTGMAPADSQLSD